VSAYLPAYGSIRNSTSVMTIEEFRDIRETSKDLLRLKHRHDGAVTVCISIYRAVDDVTVKLSARDDTPWCVSWDGPLAVVNRPPCRLFVT
jgi:hypothetical protein